MHSSCSIAVPDAIPPPAFLQARVPVPVYTKALGNQGIAYYSLPHSCGIMATESLPEKYSRVRIAYEAVKELVKNVIKSLIHHEDHEGHEEKIKLIKYLKLRALRVLRG
jgi:hypothetical protein